MQQREEHRMPKESLAQSCPSGLAGSGGQQTATPEVRYQGEVH
jgi:hypothetical protein